MRRTRLDPRLPASEAARLVDLTTMTLYRYRRDGVGPRYETGPTGRITYRLSDLEEWLANVPEHVNPRARATELAETDTAELTEVGA